MRDDITNITEIISPIKPTDTESLEEILLIKLGTRVMHTNNIDVVDDPINGRSGTVIHIVTRSFKCKDNHLQEKIDYLSRLLTLFISILKYP